MALPTVKDPTRDSYLLGLTDEELRLCNALITRQEDGLYSQYGQMSTARICSHLMKKLNTAERLRKLLK